MLIKAGVNGKPTVFLFSDNQIKEESFVEDINMILNTGDVPNIFPADEKAELIDKMQNVARVEVWAGLNLHVFFIEYIGTWFKFPLDYGRRGLILLLTLDSSIQELTFQHKITLDEDIGQLCTRT